MSWAGSSTVSLRDEPHLVEGACRPPRSTEKSTGATSDRARTGHPSALGRRPRRTSGVTSSVTCSPSRSTTTCDRRRRPSSRSPRPPGTCACRSDRGTPPRGRRRRGRLAAIAVDRDDHGRRLRGSCPRRGTRSIIASTPSVGPGSPRPRTPGRRRSRRRSATFTIGPARDDRDPLPDRLVVVAASRDLGLQRPVRQAVRRRRPGPPTRSCSGCRSASRLRPRAASARARPGSSR